MADNGQETGVPLHLRRVVTSHEAGGRSAVAMDGVPPVSSAYEHIPGMMTRLIWATTEGTTVPPEAKEPAEPG